MTSTPVTRLHFICRCLFTPLFLLHHARTRTWFDFYTVFEYIVITITKLSKQNRLKLCKSRYCEYLTLEVTRTEVFRSNSLLHGCVQFWTVLHCQFCQCGYFETVNNNSYSATLVMFIIFVIPLCTWDCNEKWALKGKAQSNQAVSIASKFLVWKRLLGFWIIDYIEKMCNYSKSRLIKKTFNKSYYHFLCMNISDHLLAHINFYMSIIGQ